MRSSFRRAALLAAIVLGLGNSSCRVKSDTQSDDGGGDDGRTQRSVVLPAPMPGMAPIVLPNLVR